VGFGAGTVAAFGTVARFARPEERGAVIAAVYVISYLAFSIPALIAGFATNAFGLRPTAEVYELVIVALAVIAAGLAVVVGRRTARAVAEQSVVLPGKAPVG
jgi:MFS family permease